MNPVRLAILAALFLLVGGCQLMQDLRQGSPVGEVSDGR